MNGEEGRMILYTVHVLLIWISAVNGACTYPFNATSGGETWISADKGELTVSDTMVSGYYIGGKINLKFDFHCEENAGDTYLLRAEQFQEIFRERTLFFLCLDIYRISDTVFYYYVRNIMDPFVSAVIFPFKETVPSMAEACQITVPRHQFITFVRKDSTDTFNYTCPVDLFAVFGNLTVVSSTDTGFTTPGSCQGSHVDVCTDRAMIHVNNNCSQTRTLSVSGAYNCLFSLSVDGINYLSLWNNDATTDETNTFLFSCFAYVRSGGEVYGTETPKLCSADTNSTHTERGLSILLTSISETCLDSPPTTTEAPHPDVSFLLYFLSIPAAIFLVWLILLVIVCLLICHRKYGSIFKRAIQMRKQSKTKVHADKVWRAMIPPNELSIIKARDTKQVSAFRPKQPIDISIYELTFETGSWPSIVPAGKLETLYPDPIEDYMKGKIPRYPSGLSLYSIDSVVFENRRSHCIHWISPSENPSHDIDYPTGKESVSVTKSSSTETTSQGTEES